MRKFKVFLYQIKYDCIQGTIISWYKFIPIFIMTIFLCLNLNLKVSHASVVYNINLEINFMDYFIYVFNGIGPFDILLTSTDFKIPISYILFNTYLILILCNYPYKDLYENGYLYLLAAGNKIYWWFSKIIWVIINTIIYYILIFTVFYIFSILNGNCNLISHPNNFILKKVIKSGLIYNDVINIRQFIYGFLMIIFVSLVITLISSILSLIINPNLGICFSIILLLSSIYFHNNFMFGNYLMLERLNIFTNYSNVNLNVGIILCFITLVITISLGFVLFKNKDLIGRIKK